MSSSQTEARRPRAVRVRMTDEAVCVELADGRCVSVPVGWYPRLLHGTPVERGNFRIMGQGEGIHWTDLDEDLSVDGLLAGRASTESQASLERWLRGRAKP